MPTMLMIQTLKPADAATLKAHYADWQFKTVSELTPADYDDVQVVFGYDPIVTTILARPTNQLKFVQTISAGVDKLPLAALKANQTLVANTSGIHADAIGESVLGGMLMFVRGYQAALRNQLGARQWALPVKTTTLTGRQLLVFGTGAIGQSVAKKAAVFQMNVTGVNTTGHPAAGFKTTVALGAHQAAVAQADFIVNALPLTLTTRGLFAESLFNAATKQPILINVGRGPAVVTADLVTALDRHQLGGAVLDVTDPEPLAADDPLWQRDDVIITPHVSGQIAHFKTTVFNIFYANLTQWSQTGTLASHQVDLQRGY
ncbi:NAD(P)-dependent oxidoreductase [Lactiplantibacillus plajomi]|nr:NAD(P)-dependent oxidoreductase [Lactiplantibacillus plajomi]